MIPVLYPATETAFTSNGLGGLPDAISCIVTEQRNTQGGYYLEMDYPIDGLHYADIAPERIIYAAPFMGATPQPFRISRINRPINGIVHIEAPHISAELQKLTSWGIDTGTNIQGMIYNQFYRARQLGQTVPFWCNTDITVESDVTFSHPEPTSLADILLGAEGSVLDVVGGEYEWDGYHIILHSQRGTDSGLEIRYGVNMSDIEAETDASELVTAVIPFWKGTVNEQDVVVMGDMCEADNASAYAYVRCVPLDVTEQFDLEQDQQPTTAQVTAKGTAFINGTGRKLLQTSIKVKYEPTTNGIGERLINLCDTVRVVYPDLGVSSISKVVETKFNTLTEQYDELTIGSIRNNIVDTIAGLISGGAITGGGGSSGGGGGSAVGAVLYNMAQSLTEAQKAQARQNIGAAAPGEGGGGGTASAAVLYTTQTLTDAQKEQARENIGAGQTTVTVENDTMLIVDEPTGAIVGYPLGGNSVRYDQAQNLTEAQKAQARSNIGIEDEQEPEFTEIDFIESDGASYINTGILPTADLKVVVKVQHALVDGITSEPRQYVLGTFSKNQSNEVVGRYQFYYSGSDQDGGSFFGWGSGSGNVGFKYLPLAADTAEHTAIINNGNFRFDGTGYVTLENPIFTVQNPIYLFALNENGTTNYYSNGLRIKSVEFSRNGETVANFVPRMRTADGELGMLETVSNVFYTNNGTGHFRNDTSPSEYPYMVVVRPEQFGAKGDGVTDDTLAIQAALDAAQNNGTVIFGKKKTYLVSRRDDDIKWNYATANGRFTPRVSKYMLKISGSMTILGQGATIAYKHPISQQEYDEEYVINFGDSEADPPIHSHPEDAKSAAMLYLDNSDKPKNATKNVDLNERHSVTIRSLILDGGMSSNGVDRSSASRNKGMSLGNWKAICAHGVFGMYLELDSVTIKDFAAEGVWGLWNPGSKIKAFGCTFSNCMPTAFNIHGAVAECIACTFNQDEVVNPDPPTSVVWQSGTQYQIGDRVHYPTLTDPVYECAMEDNTTPPVGTVDGVKSKGWISKWLQMCGGSEYAADLNIFDSCIFNINDGIEALFAGNAEGDTSGLDHKLVVRDCVFSRSNVKNGTSNLFWKSIITARYSPSVIVDSCIFNDERTHNAGQAAVSTHSFSAGQVSNCVFNRPSISANDTYYAVWAKDSTSNVVNVSSFENGGSIHGRGLIIKLFNRKEYRFSKITQPKTITIIPATDDTVFEGYGFGDENNFISVNKTVYAHLPIKINIDYMSIGRLAYSNSEDMIPDFRVVCSGHPTGTYGVWAEGTTYQPGNRVHYKTATDPVYECATVDNESPPAGEGSSGWYEVGAFNLIIET